MYLFLKIRLFNELTFKKAWWVGFFVCFFLPSTQLYVLCYFLTIYFMTEYHLGPTPSYQVLSNCHYLFPTLILPVPALNSSSGYFFSCHPAKRGDSTFIFTCSNNIIYLLISDFKKKIGRQAGNLTMGFQSPGAIGRPLSSMVFIHLFYTGTSHFS